jgi:adenylate kinase
MQCSGPRSTRPSTRWPEPADGPVKHWTEQLRSRWKILPHKGDSSFPPRYARPNDRDWSTKTSRIRFVGRPTDIITRHYAFSLPSEETILMSAPDGNAADAARPDPRSTGLSFPVYVRLHAPSVPKLVGVIALTIGEQGSLITALDVSKTDGDHILIDINCVANNREHARNIVSALRQIPQVEISRVEPPHIQHDYTRRALRVVLLAPPGAGKGTQGAIIANHFGVPHIATGDMLRSHIAHETSLGLAVRDTLARGDLVPDSIVLEMLRGALVDAKDKNGGYVIDGIPRTVEQANAAFDMASQLDMAADVALCLDVDDTELTRRLLARAAVDHRTDDTPTVIAKRLELYHHVTAPLLTWFEERGILITVDGTPRIETVTADILATLEIVYASILGRLAATSPD